jgi:hypothetical protein
VWEFDANRRGGEIPAIIQKQPLTQSLTELGAAVVGWV